jgi:hypothetical protein
LDNKDETLFSFADLPQILFGGDRGIVKLPFQLQSSLPVRSFCFSILARSASMVVTTSELTDGPGYVLQLDHFNEETQLNEFRVFTCSFVSKHEKYCEQIYKQEVIILKLCQCAFSDNVLINMLQVNLLDSGEKWKHFKFQLHSYGTVNNFTISKHEGTDQKISWEHSTDK